MQIASTTIPVIMSNPFLSSQDYAAFEAYASRAIALAEKKQLMGEQEGSTMMEEILAMHLELIEIMNGIFHKTAMKRENEQLKRYGYLLVQTFSAQGIVWAAIKVLTDHGYLRAFCR